MLLWLVILLTITVLCSTEEWCVVVVGYIVKCYCLRLNGGVACDVVVGYIVNNYCFMFNRGVVCCCGWLYC